MAAPAHNSCASLIAMKLPDTTIASADEVTGGALTLRGSRPLTDLPAFCRVVAVTRPAVRFEVWLPLDTWNGKFQGVGNGANAGTISYAAMVTALTRGYATASTDTGHQTENARDGAWAIGHPELVVDFGYRAIHVTAETAKDRGHVLLGAGDTLTVACSTGGRQALMEAQRFPEDYDGIIAGAPAVNWSRFQTGGHMWVADALNKDPESYLPATKLKAIGDAVNAACDKVDGIADGIIADPRKCTYDPKMLQCPGAQTSDLPDSEAGEGGQRCLVWSTLAWRGDLSRLHARGRGVARWLECLHVGYGSALRQPLGAGHQHAEVPGF
jgi:feruloyl esterase